MLLAVALPRGWSWLAQAGLQLGTVTLRSSEGQTRLLHLLQGFLPPCYRLHQHICDRLQT